MTFYGRIGLSFVLGAFAFAAGCITLDFGGAPERDASIQATYFDEPRVRPGVALSISVTATGTQGQASKQFFVNADGYISMELVGQLKVDGLTLVELEQKVKDAYKEYFRDPQVMATFVYQAGGGMVSPWGTVTVLGEVGRPGPVDIPSTQDLTLLRALQLAGGASALADRRRVQVTHCDKSGKQTKRKINLNEIGEEGRADMDVLLKAGDVVWVPVSWY